MTRYHPGRGTADRSAALFALFVAYSIVLVDQGSKALASRAGAVADAPLRNDGLFLGVHAGTSLTLIVLSAVVLAVFGVCVARTVVRIGVPPWIPALVAGGMIGNALDRARLGAVRDFIHSPWLIFNLADVAIALGIAATVFAFAVRVRQLRRTDHVIRFDLRRARAEIVAA